MTRMTSGMLCVLLMGMLGCVGEGDGWGGGTGPRGVPIGLGGNVDPAAMEAQLSGDLGRQLDFSGGIYEAMYDRSFGFLSFTMHARGSGWAAMNGVSLYSPTGDLDLAPGDHYVIHNDYTDEPWGGEPWVEEEPMPDPPADDPGDLEGDVIGCSGDSPNYDVDIPAEEVVVDVQESDDPDMLRIDYVATFDFEGQTQITRGSFLVPRDPDADPPGGRVRATEGF